MKRELPALFYKLLIIAATIIWGFSFVVVKDAVDAVSPAWLMGMRFVATAAILAVVFHETLHANFDTSHLFAGVVLGVLSFLGFWIQTIGITDTTPGRNAFLTATYCVMVPFLYWIVAKRRPTVFNLVAAVMCIAGVGFVSLGGDFTFSMRWGDAMTLLSAVFFALHMVMVPVFADRRDIMTITIVQIGTSGLCGIAIGALSEPTPAFSSLGIDFWVSHHVWPWYSRMWPKRKSPRRKRRFCSRLKACLAWRFPCCFMAKSSPGCCLLASRSSSAPS